MSADENREKVKRFRSYGLWGGTFLGIVVGVLAGGPRFREWEDPLLTWLEAIVACAAVGATVGFLFFPMAVGGTPAAIGTGGHDGSDGGGHGGDGGGDGGDGGH